MLELQDGIREALMGPSTSSAKLRPHPSLLQLSSCSSWAQSLWLGFWATRLQDWGAALGSRGPLQGYSLSLEAGL